MKSGSEVTPAQTVSPERNKDNSIIANGINSTVRLVHTL